MRIVRIVAIPEHAQAVAQDEGGVRLVHVASELLRIDRDPHSGTASNSTRAYSPSTTSTSRASICP